MKFKEETVKITKEFPNHWVREAFKKKIWNNPAKLRALYLLVKRESKLANTGPTRKQYARDTARDLAVANFVLKAQLDELETSVNHNEL